MENRGWRVAFFTHHVALVAQPRLQVLLKTFLRLQIFRDDDDGAIGKFLLQQRREKWLGARRNPGKSLRSARLHAPDEGLHGGSLQDVSERLADR